MCRSGRARLGRVFLVLEVQAGVEDDCGVFAVAHAERLGARKASEGDLARRCLPGARMRLFPTEMPPPGAAVERRPAIMADPDDAKGCAAVRRHDRAASFLPVVEAKSVPAATRSVRFA